MLNLTARSEGFYVSLALGAPVRTMPCKSAVTANAGSVSEIVSRVAVATKRSVVSSQPLAGPNIDEELNEDLADDGPLPMV